jgi:hypothetical protein
VASAAPVIGPWVITAGNDTIVNGNTNSPSLTPGPTVGDTSVSGNTVEAPFTAISLTDPGHYIEMTGSFNLTRNANLTSISRLNDQIRVGLFSASSDPVTLNSFNPRGIIAEYGDAEAGADGEIRALVNDNANPFAGAATTVIAIAGTDVGDDGFSGADVTINFVLRLTRQAGDTVDITGNFNGITEDATDDDYLQDFAILGHAPASSFSFSLNRAAFLVGGNADATAATLQNIDVTTNVPEPTAIALLALGGTGLAMRRRRS